MQPSPLSDPEFEEAVIGGALMGTIADLPIEAFSVGLHRDIWRKVKELEQADEPVDLLTVGQGHDDWFAALTGMVGATPSSLQSESYAERLRDLASRRAFVRACEVAVKEVYSQENTVDEVLGRHYSRSSLIGKRHSAGPQPLNVQSVVDSTLAAIADPREVWGLRSGWPQIDVELGGLHLGQTVLVAGNPGEGKSLWTGQLACQLAGLPFWEWQEIGPAAPGAVFQLEMSEDSFIYRAACGLSRVSYRDVHTGRLNDIERDRFMDACGTLTKAPIFISERTDWDTARLRVEVAGLMRDHGIRWVLVDYAGLLKDVGEGEISRERKISQGLSEIAKMGLIMIVVEQLNKNDLVYGSIQKQYDADIIFKLTKLPGKDAPKDHKRLKLDKAREADINLRFDFRIVGSQRRFEPLDIPEHFDPGEIPF